MGEVDVAHLEAGALAGKTARAHGRKTALVRQLGQRVGLVHELGQLRAAEELPDGGDDRADVDQGAGRHGLGADNAHALPDDLLQAQETDAELGLDQLADGADAAVAQVVDVIGLSSPLLIMMMCRMISTISSRVSAR